MPIKNVKINFASSISASSTKHYDLDSPTLKDDHGQETDDYAPYKNLFIYNSGSVDLKLFLNQRRGYDLIPAGTIYKIEDDNITFVAVKNTAASAGEYTLTLDNEDTQLSILKSLKNGQK